MNNKSISSLLNNNMSCSFINKDKYTLSEKFQDKDGNKFEMYITFKNLQEKSIIHSTIEGDNKFLFLANQKCADHILSEIINNNNLNLHIFEFKKTYSKYTLKDSLEQFEGAICRSIALVPFFLKSCYPNIKTIYIYLVYGETSSTDPILQRPNADISSIFIDKMEENKSDILPFIKDKIKFKKIQLETKTNKNSVTTYAKTIDFAKLSPPAT